MPKERYRICVHRKEQKERREKQVMKNRNIEELERELKALDQEIEDKRRTLKAKEAQSKRLDSKVRARQ